VQPYLALALELIKTRGHRVRLATHGAFKQLIEDSRVYLDGVSDVKGAPLADNLEFFDIGGDPQELMAYMVRSECAPSSSLRPSLTCRLDLS